MSSQASCCMHIESSINILAHHFKNLSLRAPTSFRDAWAMHNTQCSHGASKNATDMDKHMGRFADNAPTSDCVMGWFTAKNRGKHQLEKYNISKTSFQKCLTQRVNDKSTTKRGFCTAMAARHSHVQATTVNTTLPTLSPSPPSLNFGGGGVQIAPSQGDAARIWWVGLMSDLPLPKLFEKKFSRLVPFCILQSILEYWRRGGLEWCYARIQLQAPSPPLHTCSSKTYGMNPSPFLGSNPAFLFALYATLVAAAAQ